MRKLTALELALNEGLWEALDQLSLEELANLPEECFQPVLLEVPKQSSSLRTGSPTVEASVSKADK
jgi:hypothetical protein